MEDHQAVGVVFTEQSTLTGRSAALIQSESLITTSSCRHGLILMGQSGHE